MGKNITVVKYFPKEVYDSAISPVALIGDGPKNKKGDVESTIIRISPTPFGSPTKKDFHGQYFKSGTPQPSGAGTYFGDDIVQTKFGLYEHGMNSVNNEEMAKFGKLDNILGKATLVKVDGDPTRWFDIEVKRALQYHDWLLDLIDLKIMGASTQAFVNNVEVADDGGIDIWLESEVGPTVSPANAESIKQMAALLKAPKFISLPSVTVKSFQNEVLVDVVLTKETDIEPEPEEDFVAELDAILGEEDGADIEVPAELSQELVESLGKMVSAQVKAQMSVFIELWGSDFEEAREAVLALMGNAKTVGDLKDILVSVAKNQDDMKRGFLSIARTTKQLQMSQAAEVVNQMSQMERELLESEEEKRSPQKSTRQLSVAPQGAPGAKQ